ncbi:MAG TPA: hypothetical protein VIP77_07200 [Jiangellaceae bacterium]
MATENHLDRAEEAVTRASAALTMNRDVVCAQLTILLANATEASTRAAELATAAEQTYQIVGAITTVLRTLETQGREFGSALRNLDPGLVPSDSATEIDRLRKRLGGVAGAVDSDAGKIRTVHTDLGTMSRRAPEIATTVTELRDTVEKLVKDVREGATSASRGLDTKADAISIARGVTGDTG